MVTAGRREYRKVRSRRVAAAKKSREKELELSVKICLEEQLPEDPEIMVNRLNFRSCLYATPPVVLLKCFSQLRVFRSCISICTSFGVMCHGVFVCREETFVTDI